jgi:hypothetical protein
MFLNTKIISLEKIQRRRTEELLLIFIYPAGVIVKELLMAAINTIS